MVSVGAGGGSLSLLSATKHRPQGILHSLVDLRHTICLENNLATGINGCKSTPAREP